MGHKLLISFIVLMIFLFIWWMLSTDKQVKITVDTPRQLTELQEEDNEKIKSHSIEAQHSKKVKQASSEAMLNETNSVAFSDDPFVEAYSIHSRSRSCRYVSSEWFMRQVTVKKQKLIDGLHESCQDWKAQWPLLTVPKSNFSKLTATSKIGQMLKNWPKNPKDNQALQNKAMYSIDFLSEAVKVKNYYLVDRALSDILFWPESFFQSLIGGVDPYYQQEIFRIAMHTMACDFDQAEYCAPDSFGMIEQCHIDSSHCGLNYQQWMAKTLLPGMRKDVNTIVSHYQNNSSSH